MQRENRRIEYRAILDWEIAVTQLRFQTLSIFFAAVGFIVGFSNRPSKAVGVLLLAVTAGLWIIDLRNRDLLSRFRILGLEAEKRLFGEEGLLFEKRRGPQGKAVLGVLNTMGVMRAPKGSKSLRAEFIRAISFQVGIDVIFTSVASYAGWIVFRTWVSIAATLILVGVLWLVARSLPDPTREDLLSPTN